MAPLRICLVAAEVTPFAKAGGLADVVAALARHLDRAGHEVRLVMPLYGRMRELPFKDTGTDLELRVGERHYQARVRLTDLPDSNVAVRCIDAPDLYGGEALYRGDEEDAFRFAALTKAAFEVCQREGFAPDVMHAHDWHTALAPLWVSRLNLSGQSAWLHSRILSKRGGEMRVRLAQGQARVEMQGTSCIVLEGTLNV